MSTSNPQTLVGVYNQACMSSEFTYLNIYALTGAEGSRKAGVEDLRAAVEERILRVSGTEELTTDLRERLDAELAWVERGGMLASGWALARIVGVAKERRRRVAAPW